MVSSVASILAADERSVLVDDDRVGIKAEITFKLQLFWTSTGKMLANAILENANSAIL